MTTAIILSAVLSFLLGMIWYSPKVFGDVWMESIGKRNGDLNETPAKFMVSFVGWIAAAFVYGLLISSAAMDGIQDYLFLSVALWGAFMMPAKAQALLWGNFNTKLLWIDGGYMLAGYIIFAFVFRMFA